MSLEQALAANTAALQALTAAIVANPMQAPSAQPATAPFTAAVVPPPIAPVASTDSSPAPTTAFAPAVLTIPQPVVPAVPPTAAPAASGSSERDSKGMPYDGRIHSGTKAKVADGTWRYKRGVGDAYIAQVEAELRGAAAAPVPAPVHAVTPAGIGDHAAAPVVGGVGTPWPFPSEPDPAVAAVPPAPVAPPPVVTPPPAPAVAAAVPPAAGVTSYEQLMAILPTKFVAGEITAQQLQEACEKFGVPSVAALATRPDLVVFVASALGIK